MYDHPTPIDQEGTLGRTLNSLLSLKNDFKVVVIATVTDHELEEKIVSRLKKIIRPFSGLDIALFSYPGLKKIRQRFADSELNDTVSMLSLDGYSNIRNLGLLIAQLLNVELAVFIDDDEVITDPNYLSKAIESIGQEVEKEKVLGVTGYYTKNQEGDYLGSDDIPWWDIFWRKGWAMNQVLKTIGQGPRLKKTTLALGGAMIIHQELFTKVPFDPYVVRGEDIDYLINAMMFGHHFFLDNQLSVLHLPPKDLDHVLGLRQDIYRFFYEQHKLDYSHSKIDLQKITAEDLMPYPGLFLKHNINLKSFMAALMTTLRDLRQKDFGRHLKNIKIALFDSRAFARRHCRKYFDWQPRWVQLMTAIKEDEILRTRLF